MYRRLLTILALALLGFHVLTVGGCVATPATKEVATYRTIHAVALVGQATLDAAARLRVEGKITEGRWLQVAQHYRSTYQPALLFSIEMAQGDTLAPPPAGLLAVLAQLQILAQQP